MLRNTPRVLFAPTRISCAIAPSLVLFCSAKNTAATSSSSSPTSKNPFESHFAGRSQKEAGVELALTFAQRFAEVHKQKKNNTNSTGDAESQPQALDEFTFPHGNSLNHSSGFKDNRENNDNNQTDGLRKRLIFQSRYRGMAELDLILGAFAESVLPSSTHSELVEYDAILRELDTDLFHWLVTIPGRRKDEAAAGNKSVSHAKQTAQSILAGTSDYSEIDQQTKQPNVAGSTPTVDDEFIEPKELLEAEWHRKDDTPEMLEKNSIWKKLRKFCEEGREDIVKYR